MPYKSKKQAGFFFAAEKRGDMPRGMAMRMAHETPNMKDLSEKAGSRKAALARRRNRKSKGGVKHG